MTKVPSYSYFNILSYYVTDTKVRPYYLHALSAYSSLIKSKSLKEAFVDPKWIEAMKLEVATLEDNRTWSIIDLFADKFPSGCKWIFKINYKASMEVEKYKVILVAKGYYQIESLVETFAPMAKMVIVRSIVFLVIAKQWVINEIDVPNVFLNEICWERCACKYLKGLSDKGSL